MTEENTTNEVAQSLRAQRDQYLSLLKQLQRQCEEAILALDGETTWAPKALRGAREAASSLSATTALLRQASRDWSARAKAFRALVPPVPKQKRKSGHGLHEGRKACKCGWKAEGTRKEVRRLYTQHLRAQVTEAIKNSLV